jgi:hypothetical protein
MTGILLNVTPAATGVHGGFGSRPAPGRQVFEWVSNP